MEGKLGTSLYYRLVFYNLGGAPDDHSFKNQILFCDVI